jgi:hypothetical protein
MAQAEVDSNKTSALCLRGEGSDERFRQIDVVARSTTTLVSGAGEGFMTACSFARPASDARAGRVVRAALE